MLRESEGNSLSGRRGQQQQAEVEESDFYERVPGVDVHQGTRSLAAREHRRRRVVRRSLVCAAVLGAVCAVVFPTLFFVVAPKFAQSSLDHSSVVLMNATMFNPTATTIDMSAVMEMSTPGLVSAKMMGANVSVGANNVVFGYMHMPPIDANAAQLWIAMNTTLHVTDVPAFTRATAQVLQGHSSAWTIDGTPDVHVNLLGSAMKYGVTLQKTFTLPETLFVQMQAVDVTILSTGPATINASATATFFSSSVLELGDIGNLVFNLSLAVGNASVHVGEVTVPHFRASRDFNVLPGIVVSLLSSSEGEGNVGAIHDFLSTFAAGKTQQVVMRGPVRSAAPFLSDIVTQEVGVVGTRCVDNAAAGEFAITLADARGVFANSSVTFTSQMNLNASALGGVVVTELVTLDGVKIGEATFQGDVRVGVNSFPISAVLMANTTNEQRAVHAFLTNYTAGNTQRVLMRGPVRQVNAAVNGIFSAPVSVPGARAITSAKASGFAILGANSTHLRTVADIELVSDLALPMSAVGGSLTFDILDAGGRRLGQTRVASDLRKGVNLIAGAQTTLFSEPDLSNVEAIRTFLRVLSLGKDQQVTMRGPVGSPSPLLDNTIASQATLAGALLLDNVHALAPVPVSGSATHLVQNATTTFVSQTSVPKGGLGGPMTLNFTTQDGVVLGVVRCDAAIVKGYNTESSVLELRNTGAESMKRIGALTSNFLNGVTSTYKLVGPVGAVAPFLDNILSVDVVLEGQTQPLLKFAAITEDSVGGYAVVVGGALKLIRGAVLTIDNPFAAPVRQSALVMDVYLHTPLGYSFANDVLGSHDCPTTANFARQLTAKGMYKDKVSQDYVDLTPADTTNFLSPSVPQPPQAAQEMCKMFHIVSVEEPCCFLSMIPAAACHAQNVNKENFVRLRGNGTTTLDMFDFKVNVTLVQDDMQLLFDPAITAGFLKDLYLGCDEFSWH